MRIVNLFLLVFFVLQVSCSAVYETRSKYEAPEDQVGKACVLQCNYAKNDCYRQCQVKLTDCRLAEKMIDVQVNRNPFINIINNNVNRSSDYKENDRKDNLCENNRQKCMKSCENSIFCESECDMQFSMCSTEQRFKSDMNSSSGSFRKEMQSSSTSKSFGAGIKSVIPIKPVSLCRVNDCDRLCRSDYDLCFTGCGGKITTYTKCVAFCDKK
ncbi:hypothetical protein EDL79_03645 [Ehrlichia ruminantium]|uniref:Uncharacterized protein n=1 Tax=Ehrlichia ruminantium TaxID=779 RepID=A0AAE6QAE4_EHRRU|nr:hypothetical protein [Ehrlichia ruminantium]QGR02713.1 hypothetical protein EDL81_03630 [Ehrlichia ruminantium]QGR03634.1 hypothetical protein EDL80_03635 [Ehrlichia ruminantium]QGR04561.1 hypothetical protein EDL79_03645 [Ehrlichia ruminantium]